MVAQRAAVVGDIHGDAAAIAAILPLLTGRHIVFVGDLVNRGPDTRRVLDIVADLVVAGTATVVRGNHESALLSYLRGESGFVDFALAGGLPTLKSYLPQPRGDVWRAFVAAFPGSHRRLLEAAHDEYWLGEMLIRHWDDAAEHALVNGVGATSRGKPLVVGHTVVAQPRRIGDVVLLDSGCGTPGGTLSAFLWPEEEFVSVRGSESSASPWLSGRST